MAAMVSLVKYSLQITILIFVLQDGLVQLLVLVGLIAMNRMSGTVSFSHSLGHEDKG